MINIVPIRHNSVIPVKIVIDAINFCIIVFSLYTIYYFGKGFHASEQAKT